MAGSDNMMMMVVIGAVLIGGFFLMQSGGLDSILGKKDEPEPAEPAAAPAEGAEGAEGQQQGMDPNDPMGGMQDPSQMGGAAGGAAMYPGMPYGAPFAPYPGGYPPGPVGYPIPRPPVPYGGPNPFICQSRFRGSCNKECAFGPNPLCAQCRMACGPGYPRPPIIAPPPLPLPIPRPPVNPCAGFCFGPFANPPKCRMCTDALQSRFGPANISPVRAYPAYADHRWKHGKHYAYGQPGGLVNPNVSPMGMQHGGPHSKAFYGGCSCGR